MKNVQLRHSALLLLTAAIWGVAFVAQSVGMEYVGGFTFNAVRFLIGAIVLLPFLPLSHRLDPSLSAASSGRCKEGGASRAASRQTLLVGAAACGFFLFAASNFQQFGIKYSTVGKAGFITAFYIILVPIFGMLLGKKCSPLVWLAVALSLIGLYLLCVKESFSLTRGDALLLVCAFLFTFQILAVDHFSPLVNSIKLSIGEFLVSSLLSGVMAFIFESPSWDAIYEARIPILYAGVMSSGVAYTLQIIGQRDLNPTIASLIMSLESAIAAIAGFFILHQSLSRQELLGCLVMFAAIIIAQLPWKSPGMKTDSVTA